MAGVPLVAVGSVLRKRFRVFDTGTDNFGRKRFRDPKAFGRGEVGKPRVVEDFRADEFSFALGVCCEEELIVFVRGQARGNDVELVLCGIDDAVKELFWDDGKAAKAAATDGFSVRMIMIIPPGE